LDDGSDPRVFFAAERTLLAWVRTGLAVIGLGFVVARFGLFLQLARGDQLVAQANSATVGIALVVMGSLMMIGAGWQYVRFCARLPHADQPRGYWTGMGLLATLLLAALGLALAGLLLWEVDVEQAL
jgi:putative membrane protein